MTFDYKAALIETITGLLDNGMDHEALLQAKHFTSRFRNDPEAFRQLGRVYAQMDLGEDAVKSFTMALKLDPDLVMAEAQLKMLQSEAGASEAIELLYGIISRQPENVEAFTLLGRILNRRNRPDAAIDFFRKAADLRPHSSAAHWELGKAYMAMGDDAKATQIFDYALEIYPDMAKVYQSSGHLHVKHGQVDKALDCLKRAYAIDPSNSEIAYDFAVLLDRCGDILNAYEVVKEFIDYRNHNPKLFNLLSELNRKVWLPGHPSRRSDRRPTDQRLVVFIGDELRGRQAKISYALRKAGWRTVLLHKQEPNLPVNDYFDEARCYTSEWEALSFAREYSPLVYHLFSTWYGRTTVTFMRHKPGKTIYDYTDDFAQIKSANAVRGIPYQRFCVENADGLCCRDPRIQHTARELNYHLQGHAILFPDYCWDPELNDIDRVKKLDGIHVVSVGSFGIEKLGQTEFGYLDIAQKLTNRGVHFHIYPIRRMIQGPMRLFNSTFSDYVALAEKTPYLHLHKPVPMEQVIPEISQYHIGASIVRALMLKQPLKEFTQAHFQYCGSVRIFDFLEAGLPIILNSDYGYQNQLMEKYGIVINATSQMLDEADIHLKQFVSEEMRGRVQRARLEYSISQNIQRLIQFYEQVGNDQDSQLPAASGF